MNDILTGLSPVVETAPTSDSEVEATLDDIKDELHRAKKKLKKAKKKGKGGKKLKKKIKKLKAKSKDLERQIHGSAASAPYRGRWDGLIEKSVPEAIKLTTAVVNRAFQQPTRQVVYVSKDQVKRLPQSEPTYQPQAQPAYIPQGQPLYLPQPQPLYIPGPPIYLPSSQAEDK